MTFKQGHKKVGANFSFLALFFVFQIAYKADYKHDVVDYNYPATLTPSYQTTMKLVPLKDVSPSPIDLYSSSLPSNGVIVSQLDRKKQGTAVLRRHKGLRKSNSFLTGGLYIHVWKLLDFQHKAETTLVSFWKYLKVPFHLLEFETYICC